MEFATNYSVMHEVEHLKNVAAFWKHTALI